MIYGLAKNVKKCLINLKYMNLREKSGIFPYFLFSWRSKWRSMTSNLKFSLWSMLTTKIRGCMQNFSLLSQFLRPNTACTKFDVTKCQSATPPPYFNLSPVFRIRSDPYHLVGSGSVSESVDKSKSLYFLKFLIVLLHFARFRNI